MAARGNEMARQALSKDLEQIHENSPRALAVAPAAGAIATWCIEISRLTGSAASSAVCDSTQSKNLDGDPEKDLDVKADRLIRHVLSRGPIAAFASRADAGSELCDQRTMVCVAVDPLDGSSGIEINITLGTIFPITPSPQKASAAFRHKGTEQIATARRVYGPADFARADARRSRQYLHA